MKNIIPSILALLAFIACENAPSDKIISVSKEEVLELIDTIAIDIDAELMGDYVAWSISEDNYFVAYHYLLHKIDVFNLSDQKFSYSIRLDNQGPNGVNPLGGVIKTGTEYFATSGMYYRISPEGLVFDKKMFSELSISKEGYMYGQKGPQLANFTFLSMDAEKHGFFQPIYKYKESGVLDFSAYFMSFIDYTNWKSTYVPVNYPSSFLEAHSKSIPLGNANMIRSGSSLISNFPCANEIYEYDTLTKIVITHSPEILNKEEMNIDISEYGVGNFVNSLEYFNSLGDAQMSSPRYLPILHDEKNKLYYRLHKNKAEGKDEYGIDMFSASFFLIKMDSNFNTLAQYELGKLFNPKFEVHDGYLYFTPKEVDKTALHFLKIYRMKP